MLVLHKILQQVTLEGKVPFWGVKLRKWSKVPIYRDIRLERVKCSTDSHSYQYEVLYRTFTGRGNRKFNRTILISVFTTSIMELSAYIYIVNVLPANSNFNIYSEWRVLGLGKITWISAGIELVV